MSKGPKIIFSIFSEKNGWIKVVDSSGGRELQGEDGGILSCSENHTLLKSNYWGIFLEYLPKYRPQIKNALVFGLGGGVIQNKLFKMYPGIQITTIEYDPLMNDIYNYYFSGDKYDNHRILNMSGESFVKNHHRLGDFENKFDLVFVDTFSSFNKKEYDSFNTFYKNTKSFLREGGLFSVNMIVWSEEMFEESKIYLEKIKTFYKDTKLAFVGTAFGNSNIVTFSSDKLNL